MRWCEIVKPIPNPAEIDEAIDQPNRVDGPLFGVPVEEVRAWVHSLTTDKPLAKPKERCIR